MRSLVQLRWFKFGNKYLLQKIGIPIGVPVSVAVLEAVLSVDEYMFEKFEWGRLAAPIGLSGPREHWLAIARYVDDIFIASRWFCPHCVESLTQRIYGKTVTFDQACDELTSINNHASVKFLDLWCYLSWTNQFFGLVKKATYFQ